MLQQCNPHLSTKDWKVVKVEQHEGDINNALLVLNKDSVAQIETVLFVSRLIESAWVS